MKYYPVFLNVRNMKCVVVGGGEVAERKVFSLLNAGAKVTIISPDTTANLTDLEGKGQVAIVRRSYMDGDLKGAFLAYAATDNEDINTRVYMEAKKEGVLLNVVDDPDKCGFIVPSVVERGDLSIAISTGGASPAFAKKLRLELEESYGQEYAVFLEIMAAIRQKLLTKEGRSGKNRRVFNMLASSSIPELIRQGRWDEIEKTIVSILGEDFSLASLGIEKA